ncbi:MAG: alpha/beta fold hydrolase [Myxococcota bacterium]
MAPYWLLLVPTALFAWTTIVAAVGVAIQAADRNEPIAASPALFARIAREAGARAALRLASWLAWGRPDPKPSQAPQNPRLPPVLLVPGLTWNRAGFWPLATFLRRRGWRWVFPIDRRDRDGTLATEAEGLAAAITALRAASGATRVDLVAFSTGGLVAAWYLRHHGATNVRRLVTVGTGWSGTRLAVFGRGRSVEEIRYGSHVLDGLWPPAVPTVCVFSPDDPVIVPASSAIPPHGADAVRIDECGHVDMLLSARVFRAVQAALDLPSHAAVDPVDPGATIVPVDRAGAE